MSHSSQPVRPGQAEASNNSNPEVIHEMPARPYRILHADLPFYSDPDCLNEVEGKRLIVLRCEDPKQKQNVVECMPTSKRYVQGQIVSWDIDPKKLSAASWYRNPDSGNKARAWAQSVEFIGKVVAPGSK